MQNTRNGTADYRPFSQGGPPSQKLCDFTPDTEGGPRETNGIRIVKPIENTNFRSETFKGGYKERRFQFDCYKDVTTGEWYGLTVPPMNQDGTFNWRTIVLFGEMFYDLSNTVKSMEYHVVKTCPAMQGSPYRTDMPPSFRTVDPEADAKKFVVNFNLERTTVDQVMAMSEEDINKFATLFVGEAATKNSPIINKKIVIEKIQKNPKYVSELLNNKDRTDVMILFEKAIIYNLIKDNVATGVQTVTGMTLGINRTSAIDFLMKNREMVDYLSHEIGRFDKPELLVRKPSTKEEVEKIWAVTETMTKTEGEKNDITVEEALKNIKKDAAADPLFETDAPKAKAKAK